MHSQHCHLRTYHPPMAVAYQTNPNGVAEPTKAPPLIPPALSIQPHRTGRGSPACSPTTPWSRALLPLLQWVSLYSATSHPHWSTWQRWSACKCLYSKPSSRISVKNLPSANTATVPSPSSFAFSFDPSGHTSSHKTSFSSLGEGKQVISHPRQQRWAPPPAPHACGGTGWGERPALLRRGLCSFPALSNRITSQAASLLPSSTSLFWVHTWGPAPKTHQHHPKTQVLQTSGIPRGRASTGDSPAQPHPRRSPWSRCSQKYSCVPFHFATHVAQRIHQGGGEEAWIVEKEDSQESMIGRSQRGKVVSSSTQCSYRQVCRIDFTGTALRTVNQKEYRHPWFCPSGIQAVAL